MSSTVSREHFFAGGRFVRSSSTQRTEVINPYTQQSVGVAALGTIGDIDVAVGQARDALPGWAATSPADRSAVMHQIADGITALTDDIGALVTSEMGGVISVTRASTGADLMRYFADLGPQVDWEERRDGVAGPGLVRRVPVGVAALIVPWNAPFGLMMQKIAPALMAGCTVVAKPSAETPLDAFLLADVIQASDLPPGVINIVPADAVAGDHLVRHPDVSKVSFTGSTAAGKRVMAACAVRMTRCTSELGGKSAAILLDDADLEHALPQIAMGGFLNNGQACIALSRVLAPRHLYDQVVAGLADIARSLPVGDPMDANTAIGPLINERQHGRVMRYIHDALATDGVKAAAGGRSGEKLFVEPTVLTGVTNDMGIAQEEVFGPVQVVIPYDGTDDAVAIANDSRYGLSGSVWSRDADAALAVARRIRTGTISINGFRLDHAMPFGGFKESGIGREYGPEGLDAYLELQSVLLPA